jgi:hypothetical protein
MIFDPADPNCENDEILRYITSILIGASGKCWQKGLPRSGKMISALITALAAGIGSLYLTHAK